ncbi:type VII secretion-associated protein [Gordonia shandongensis]|uniref:type VII secretion-associated protein n=1 Tax=Gordonia shandongensis TaxID=376351 RepID=UPI000419693C|nr:type VII secretion-associated protein [Gordonia shandongensis]
MTAGGRGTGPVLDLGFGVVDSGAGSVDVGPLVEDIDDVARRSRVRPVLAELARGIRGPLVVLHPTVWGGVRVPALLAELAGVGLRASAIPRAVAVAAAHADAGADRCAVVETALVPETGGHWSVHAVGRVDGRWVLGDGRVTAPGAVAGDEGWRVIVTDADAVVVDGPDPAEVASAVALLTDRFGVRAQTADRERIRRHGDLVAPISAADLLSGQVPAPPSAGRRSVRGPIAAAVVLAVVAIVGAVVVHWPRGAASGGQRVAVGRVSVVVPGDWPRTDIDPDADDGAGRRSVFAAPDGGARLIVVSSRLRVGSTAETVATSLRNRIAQRGDDAVADFAADLDYAGRRVIGYRETPASGTAISWYVIVAAGVQGSVGCQRGTGDEGIEGPCRDAVASMRVRS